MRTTWTVFALLTMGSALAQEALPITRVVLFRSGVGYIERLGRVEGEASLTLSLRETQMNDLLKSLVLVDFDGGQILPVQYTPRDPLSRTLSAFAINIADNPSLATLLSRLRGAAVEIQTDKETVQGTVLSVETRKTPADETVVDQSFVNLMTRDGLRSLALNAVRSFRVRDERLQKELQDALAALATGLDNTRKTVELHFRGQGTRRVLVGYLTEMPLWKMTYRLVIGEGEPLLQGWAIVENTTDEDWRNVRVELVSGRPVSFIQNLYEPVYPQRPRVQTQTDEALLPNVPEAAMHKQETLRAAPDAPGFGAPTPRALADADAALRESIVEMATGQERGALFDYRIDQPVTVLRQQSAMLPVLNRTVQAETVSLYNPANHPRHPFFGVKLTNTTDLTLMEGPVTVYLNGSYGGDAQLTTLEPKGERVLTFALDLGMEVALNRTNETSQQISVKIARGVLEQHYQLRRENEYLVVNRDGKPRTLLIEQPFSGAWELVEPRDAERTANFYRFRLRLEPNQTRTLKVVEQRTEQETIALLQASDDVLRVFVQNQRLSEPVRQALATILNRRRAISNLDAEIRQQEAKIRAISDDQARIRENMKQLDRNSELYRQYVQKLMQQEREIEEARRAIQRLEEQRARAQRELSDYIAGLSL
ncbi:MAG: hypothetical protein CFK49_09125 [Armatimonadetes bacterium JP3_11]|nr:MAG: hypothetical protein CFK48_06315 [Armatimonadetes bacterium CP1_7O]OYT74296.1 MAG: hypothetical protein CFK49_09125 [Armatimonadetes bacterium JP3_11]RMH07657.1 MAG: hypothetical protein D6697_08030 [Armatimonadota bacterium]